MPDEELNPAPEHKPDTDQRDANQRDTDQSVATGETMEYAPIEQPIAVEPNDDAHPSEEVADNSASELEQHEAGDAAAEHRPRTEYSRHDRSSRPRRERPPMKRPGKKPVGRFVTVSFSAQREPVDDIIWCEAERDGAWIKIISVEMIRTRREVLERLTELDSALVGLDFGFSYPAPLMEFLREQEKIEDWPALLKKVRESLKKNVEDGLRHWIELIGRYREAHLEPNSEPIRTWERGRYGSRQQVERKAEPYEQRSMAERFRRTEHAIRRAADQALTSTLQVAYNKLTQRYEFSDTMLRGKKSLLGMSMLEQFIEAKPDAAIWPWKKPANLTIVEIFPWLFRREGLMSAKECRVWLEAEEDSGTDIPAGARDMILRNDVAQRMFFALMGLMRTESRVERAIRPLRDYPDQFYDDAKVKQEGWFYGVGYRLADPEGDRTGREKGKRKDGDRKNGDRREGGTAGDRKRTDRPDQEHAQHEQPNPTDAVVAAPTVEVQEHQSTATPEPTPEAAIGTADPAKTETPVTE